MRAVPIRKPTRTTFGDNNARVTEEADRIVCKFCIETNKIVSFRDLFRRRSLHAPDPSPHYKCRSKSARFWYIRLAPACSPLIVEATIRCSQGRPAYTVARAECAPEPYTLFAPRSHSRAKHRARLFSSFVVSPWFMPHCRKV